MIKLTTMATTLLQLRIHLPTPNVKETSFLMRSHTKENVLPEIYSYYNARKRHTTAKPSKVLAPQNSQVKDLLKRGTYWKDTDNEHLRTPLEVLKQIASGNGVAESSFKKDHGMQRQQAATPTTTTFSPSTLESDHETGKPSTVQICASYTLNHLHCLSHHCICISFFQSMVPTSNIPMGWLTSNVWYQKRQQKYL